VSALRILQGAVGYIQYFNRLPIDLVEVHILGAGVLLVAMVRFNLAVGGRLAIQVDPDSNRESGRSAERPHARRRVTVD